MTKRDATIRILILACVVKRRFITATEIVKLAETYGDADGMIWGGIPPIVADVAAVMTTMLNQRLLFFVGGYYGVTPRGSAQLDELSKARSWHIKDLLFFQNHNHKLERKLLNSIWSIAMLELGPPTAMYTPSPRPARGQAGIFARIDAPTSVVLGEEFTLVVGISSTRRPNVVGGILDFKGVEYPLVLTIFVAPDRFALRPGESTLQRIDIVGPDHFPTLALHLRALGPLLVDDREERVIVVCYSVLSRTIGYGSVTINVVPADYMITDERQTIAPAMRGNLAIGPTPDMTITVLPVDSTSGLLHWKLESPHLDALSAPVESKMGTDGLNFAVNLAQLIDSTVDNVPALIRGISRRISDAMPSEFDSRWTELRIKLGTGHIPTVQIYSQEPYIPWELAYVEPLFDAGASRMLGIQADVGRWVLGARNRPRIPPLHQLDLAPIAAVTGIYSSPHQRLVHAEEEGRMLTSNYGAEAVDANPIKIEQCIDRGIPPAKIIHFALHGVFDALPQYRGLVMRDGGVLSDVVVEGFDARYQPFIFLNACEVGQGAEMLGQYGGMAAAFLLAGARGVIAPLWKIDDEIAKQIALEFYRRVALGDSPAQYLRSVRRQFSEQQSSPTYLAYLFFGHPALRADVDVDEGLT